MSYDRIAILQVGYGGGDVVKVQLVKEKHRADLVVCVR